MLHHCFQHLSLRYISHLIVLTSVLFQSHLSNARAFFLMASQLTTVHKGAKKSDSADYVMAYQDGSRKQ